MISHRFSMGLRSGDCAGQSRTSILRAENHCLVDLDVWGLALSYWKIRELWATISSKCCSSVSWYTAETVLVVILASPPTPSAEKHPQTITEPQACFTVETAQTSYFSSCPIILYAVSIMSGFLSVFITILENL